MKTQRAPRYLVSNGSRTFFLFADYSKLVYLCLAFKLVHDEKLGYFEYIFSSVYFIPIPPTPLELPIQLISRTARGLFVPANLNHAIHFDRHFID